MPRPTHLTVTELTRSILVRDVLDGAVSPHVGFEDAERTYSQSLRRLRESRRIPMALLESALWSSNLLNECGEWVHPDHEPFNEWIDSIFKGHNLTFDKFWNRIDEKELTNVGKNRRA